MPWTLLRAASTYEGSFGLGVPDAPHKPKAITENKYTQSVVNVDRQGDVNNCLT